MRATFAIQWGIAMLLLGAAKTCTSDGFGQCDLDELPLIRYNFADEMVGDFG